MITTLNLRVSQAINNKIGLKEMGVNTRNWIDLDQDKDYLESPCGCDVNLQVS